MHKWSDPNYMDPKIKSLVENSNYTCLADENSSYFQDYFYASYQNLCSHLEIDCIPLEFDNKTKSFHFLAKCIETTNKLELMKWQDMFLEHYYDLYEDEDSEDNVEDDFLFNNEGNLSTEERQVLEEERLQSYMEEPLLELPDINYRISNNKYAQEMVQWLIWQDDELPDDYGWIENRKTEFFKELGLYCDTYLLQRMPISFNPNLHIIASEDEEESFLNLAADRQTELDALKTAEMARHSEAKNNIASSLTEKEKTEKYKELYDEHQNNIKIIELDCTERWTLDNKELEFPSSIGEKYTVEMAAEIQNNVEIITDFKIDTLDEFVEYKPKPKSDKNDFSWN